MRSQRVRNTPGSKALPKSGGARGFPFQHEQRAAGSADVSPLPSSPPTAALERNLVSQQRLAPSGGRTGSRGPECGEAKGHSRI